MRTPFNLWYDIFIHFQEFMQHNIPSLFKKTLHLLQNRPVKVLNRNIGLDRIIKQSTSITVLENVIQRYQRKEPIFLLLECFGYACHLNRKLYPHRRHAIITTLMQYHYLFYKQPLRYLSLGSGALLQDAIILAHILPRYCTTHLVIHCIDPLYEKLTDTINHSLDEQMALATLRARSRQFTHWIKTTFPQISTTIHWHTDLKSYRSCCKSTLPTAELVCTIDTDLQLDGAQLFNPHAHGIHLSLQPESPDIITINITPPNKENLSRKIPIVSNKRKLVR